MIYSIEADQTDTNSIIYEFHRHLDGTKETKKIVDFKPYFYVDDAAPIEQWEGVISTEEGFKSIDKTDVKKVVMQKSSLIKPTRLKLEEQGYKCWEADVQYHNRYTIDKVDFGEGKAVVCWLDIETDTPDDKFPDIELADAAISCLSTKIGTEKVSWLCSEAEDIKWKWEDLDIEGTRYFKREEDMLKDFLSYLSEKEPDILCAWNINDFDLRYVVTRLERLGIDFKQLSILREVFVKSYAQRTYVRIKGTVVLDLLEAYKLWRKYGNLPLLQSYSLDFVAREVLKKTKKPLSQSMGWLWRNDPKTLVEYNKWDVELLDLIDKRCKIVDFFDEIRRKCCIQFDDVYRTTAMIDGFLMKRLNKTVILPTAHKEDGGKFEGAYVVDPKKGLYKNILCEDIASMYPSIIKNYNISYETIGGTDIILPTGHSFSKEKGIIPMFLDELALERKGFKKKYREAKTEADRELWDQRQFGTKIIMNSIYGYLGYPGSRLYKKDVATSVTAMARLLINKIIEWTEKGGNTVIYGDTDSCYIQSNEKDKFQVVLEGLNIRDMINEKLRLYNEELVGHNLIFIEFEKALKKVLFTEAKKRYAYILLWDEEKNFDVDNELHIQGFDGIRSDSNQVSKLVQKKVIEMIMEEKQKEEVVEYVRNMDQAMRQRKFSDEAIGIPKGITKEIIEYNPPGPIHKGAVYSNKYFDTNFGKGSKPKFVWIKNVENHTTTVNMTIRNKEGNIYAKEYTIESFAYNVNIPKEVVIDWKRMTNTTFQKKLENIFNAVGWAWQPLNTMSLESFFGG